MDAAGTGVVIPMSETCSNRCEAGRYGNNENKKNGKKLNFKIEDDATAEEGGASVSESSGWKAVRERPPQTLHRPGLSG